VCYRVPVLSNCQPQAGFVRPSRAVRSDHQDQPGQWICQPMESSQVRPSGPTRTVDLSVHAEQPSQTNRTNQDSGSVSPCRAVKSDHQDQPGQWICQPIQSVQVGPSGLTRTVELSTHTERSSQTIRTNQDSESVSPKRAVKSDHQDQPGQWICQPIKSSQVRPSGPTRTVYLSS